MSESTSTSERFHSPDSVSLDVIEDEVGIQIYYDTCVNLLKNQLDAIGSLDAKSNTTLSVGSAVLPLSLGIIRAIEENPPMIVLMPVCLAAAAYVVLVGFWFLATARNQGAQVDPNLTEMSVYLESGDYQGIVLKLWAANAYHESTETNADLLAIKGAMVSYAQYALIVECGLLAFAGVCGLVIR